MRSKAANFIAGCCVMLYVPAALAEMACNFTLEKNGKPLFNIVVEGLGNFEERLIFIPESFSEEDKEDLKENGIGLSKVQEYKFEVQKDDNGDLRAVLFGPTAKPLAKILGIPIRGKKKTAEVGVLQAFFPGPKKTKFRIRCGDEKVLLPEEKSVTVSDTSATNSGPESPQETVEEKAAEPVSKTKIEQSEETAKAPKKRGQKAKDVSESVLSVESRQETKENEKTKITKQPKRKVSQKADATKKKRGRKSKQDLQKESPESEDESVEQGTESAQADASHSDSSSLAPSAVASTSVVISVSGSVPVNVTVSANGPVSIRTAPLAATALPVESTGTVSNHVLTLRPSYPAGISALAASAEDSNILCNDESNFESVPLSRQTSSSFQHLYGGLESLSGSGSGSILGNGADVIQERAVGSAVSSRSSVRPFLYDSVVGSAGESGGTRGLSLLDDSIAFGGFELDNDEPTSAGSQPSTTDVSSLSGYSPMTLGNFNFSDFQWEGLLKDGMFNTLPDSSSSASSYMDTHDY